MSPLKVSVVIPTLNSARTLESCLTAIRKSGSKYAYEIIIVDADSTDDTLELARPHVDRILKGEPGRINRNIGIEIAQGEIICFTDSDCIVPPNWMNDLVDGLLRLHRRDNRIVGVGGGNVPLLENSSLMELVIAEAFRSPLVSFRARNTATYSEEREVIHNPPHNSALFKWAILEVGGFEEAPGYGYGEDSALDARLIDRGYKLYYIPNLLIQHKHASSFKKFARQMYAYGWGRVKLGRKYKKYFRFHHYSPIFLCLMTFSPLIFIPLGMAIINALYVMLKEKKLSLFLPLVLLTMTFYVTYGFGEIVQFIKGLESEEVS